MSDDSDSSNRESRGPTVSRRHLVKAGGLGAVSLVAGCTGDGDQTPTSEGNQDDPTPTEGGDATPTEGTTVVDQTLKTPTVTNPSVINFNNFALKNTPDSPTYELLWDYLAIYHPTEAEWYPMIANEWSIEGETATLEINENYTWHDGNELTADDVVAQLTLDRIVGEPQWDFIESVEASGDYTVSMSVPAVNPSVFWYTFMDAPVFGKPDLYSDVLDAWADASSEDAEASVQQDLVNKRVGPEQVIGNGPFELDTVDTRGVELSRYADYPGADSIDFSSVRAIAFSGAQGEYQAVVSDRLDVLDSRGGMPQTVRNNLPSHWEIYNTAGYQDVRLVFSYNSDTVGGDENRRVRQAVASVIDQSKFPPIGGPQNKKASEWQTQLANVQDEEWLSDVLDGFTNYGGPDVGWTRPDQAATFLEEAGYERNGQDQWVSSETGDRLEIPVKYPAGWTGAVPMYKNAAQQLQSFGIDAPAVGVENTTLFGQTIPNEDFELTWRVMSGEHPYDRYRTQMGTLLSNSGQPRTEVETMEVPWPVGEPDGSLKTVNINEKIRELGRTTDSETEARLIRELSWTSNQWMPVIECWEKKGLHAITRDQWEWPESGTDFLRLHPYKLLKLTDGIAKTNS